MQIFPHMSTENSYANFPHMSAQEQLCTFSPYVRTRTVMQFSPMCPHKNSYANFLHTLSKIPVLNFILVFFFTGKYKISEFSLLSF